MTSGTRAWAKAAVVLLAATAMRSVAAPQEIDAQELMRMLAGVASATASFVETRYSPLLKSPLVTRGVLSYRRPDLLEKHVEFPSDERMVLEGDRLTMESASADRRLTTSVGAAPDIASLIESVRATRAGDLAALERYFMVGVDGTRDSWRLRLTPLTPALGKYVRSVEISGSGVRMQRIEVQEASGDRTVMEIEEQPR